MASPLGSGGSSGANGNSGGDTIGNDKEKSDDNQPGGMIQADAATNSLIITAAEPVYRNLRAVIDQLDARRAQVYIEALIVELNSNTNANLGIQWQVASGSVLAGTNLATGNSNSIINLTAGAGGGLPAVWLRPRPTICSRASMSAGCTTFSGAGTRCAVAGAVADSRRKRAVDA